MKLDPIRARVLCVEIIPNVDRSLKDKLNLMADQRSLGLLTVDCDDVGYTAIDEATKQADVTVVYCESMYGGFGSVNTKQTGEFIGILAGPDPETVQSGLDAAVSFVENGPSFYSGDDEGKVPFYAYTIARAGSYLSKIAGIEEGESLAYCIAPPLESICGLDAAIKGADVKLACFYGPPTRTNFGGGLLTGTKEACEAACEAFSREILKVAGSFDERESFSSDIDYGKKKEHFTWVNKKEMVLKNDVRIKLRGGIDAFYGLMVEAEIMIVHSQIPELIADISIMRKYAGKIMHADATASPLPFIDFKGWSPEEIRDRSHYPEKYYGINHFRINPKDGPIMGKLNIIRTEVRKLEILAVEVFESTGITEMRGDFLLALNRFSSLAYILMCRLKSGDYYSLK